MSLDRNDVKRGIDVAAKKLKTATDRIADGSGHAADQVSGTAKALAQKTGDALKASGQKLKDSAR
jgi:hypothetical protein